LWHFPFVCFLSVSVFRLVGAQAADAEEATASASFGCPEEPAALPWEDLGGMWGPTGSQTDVPCHRMIEVKASDELGRGTQASQFLILMFGTEPQQQAAFPN
jgi:hypothetical protein